MYCNVYMLVRHCGCLVMGSSLNPGLNIIKTLVPRHSCLMPGDEYSTILKVFAHDEAPGFELSAALES